MSVVNLQQEDGKLHALDATPLAEATMLIVDDSYV
jgi:hypothetical protein